MEHTIKTKEERYIFNYEGYITKNWWMEFSISKYDPYHLFAFAIEVNDGDIYININLFGCGILCGIYK